jgi:putative NADPH-quinone reductase
MTDHVPDEGEVKDAWVDFRVDHTNQPLKYDEAVAQYEAFLVKVKADALFDYADMLVTTMSIFGDSMTEADMEETERWIEAVRNRGHQIKKGS